MLMIYALLIIIAIGVLLISPIGRNLLKIAGIVIGGVIIIIIVSVIIIMVGAYLYDLLNVPLPLPVITALIIGIFYFLLKSKINR